MSGCSPSKLHNVVVPHLLNPGTTNFRFIGVALVPLVFSDRLAGSRRVPNVLAKERLSHQDQSGSLDGDG